MSSYYPVMLKLKEKKVLVIGGGQVATRKISSLLTAQAQVEVISPEASEQIIRWAQLKQLKWNEKSFEATDITEAFLVLAATNHSIINKEVYQVCASAGIPLVSIVDRPDLSNFILPATLRRGKLIITVSTSGASPSLAQRMKEELAEQYDHSYEEYLRFLEACREQVLHQVQDLSRRRRILKAVSQPYFQELTKLGLYAERDEHFTQMLQEDE